MSISTSKLKKKLLRDRGVVLEKHTRNLITYADLPAPYKKSSLMKFIEAKYKDRVENLIFDGTLTDVAHNLGIDFTTVSKWRKIIRSTRDQEFWKEFPKSEVIQNNK